MSKRQRPRPATATATTDATDALLELLQPQRLTAVVDIGANPIDGDPPYAQMLARGLCTVTGFEPQPEALASLQQRKGPLETYLPHAIGDGSTQTLRVTAISGMTSLFEPDLRQLELFHHFAGWGQVVRRVPLPTQRLDDVEVGPMDLLKIDIQGGELMAFQNGRERLRSAVAVHTEVSFVPLYEGQPCFGDVDIELRAQGFVPHALAAFKRWPIAPLVVGNDPRRALNQMLEADVVYVRDFAYLERMDPEQLKHLALLAQCLYGSADLALRCLLALAAMEAVPDDAPDRFLQSINI